jgi:hypothetical protein
MFGAHGESTESYPFVAIDRSIGRITMKEKSYQIVFTLFEHVHDAVGQSVTVFLQKAQCTVGHFAGIVMDREGEFVVSIDGITLVFIRTIVIIEFLD